MAWSKLVDMKMTPEECADYGMTAPEDAPQYPYGLRICFSEAEMQKLGLDAADAEIGSMVDIRAFGTVTSVSQSKKADGTSCARVEIQLERVAVEDEMTEAE